MLHAIYVTLPINLGHGRDEALPTKANHLISMFQAIYVTVPINPKARLRQSLTNKGNHPVSKFQNPSYVNIAYQPKAR